MNGFCEFCGTQLAQGSTTCHNCGANVNQSQPVQANGYQQYAAPAYPQAMTPPPKKKKTGLIIGIVIAVVLLILGALFVIGVIAMASVEDYQEPVEAWGEAIENDDVDDFYDAYIDVWSEIGYTENQVKSSLQNTINFYRSELEEEFGDDDYEITMEYGDIKEFDEDEVDEANEKWVELGYDDLDIEEAYEIEATLTAECDGEKVESDEYTFVVVLVDGEWGIFEVRGLPTAALQ